METLVTKNARRCTICGALADLHKFHFQCTRHEGHCADLVLGIFTDLSFDPTGTVNNTDSAQEPKQYHTNKKGS